MLGVQLGGGTASADPTFSISGQILDASSTPINGQTVELEQNANIIFVTTSAGAGNYSFDGVATGAYSVVVLPANGYERSSVNGTVSTTDVTNLDLTITAPSTLAGHVLNAASLPTNGIDVEADFWDSVSENWIDGNPSPINADGSYSVSAINGTGPYRILFSVLDDSLPFLSTYYGQVFFIRNGVDTTQTGIVNVTAPVAITGLDVTITPAGYISGTVTSKGLPVPDQRVIVITLLSNNGGDFENVQPGPADGSYTVKVPADTVLYVAAESGTGDYYPQIYKGQYLFGTNFQSVTVAPGATVPNIDFSLFAIDLSELIELQFLPIDQGTGLNEAAEGGETTLHVVGPGSSVVDYQSQILTDQSIILSDTPGDYEFEFTNATGQRLAIDSFTNPNLGTVVPTNPCVLDYGPISQADLTSTDGEELPIGVTLDSDLTLCNSTPTTPTTHHHSATVAGSTTVVAAPTPTPTPTATVTPNPSATTRMTATATPKPLVIPASSGLPWWIWLLIVVGILIIIAIAIALFRRR